MENYFANLIFTLIVAIIGSSGVIGFFFYRLKKKSEYNETLFVEYKSIAQELVEILKDLLSLSFIPNNYSDKQLNEIAENLSHFYYKYYLVLPQSVLREIQCLHSCLHRKGKRLFEYYKDEQSQFYKQRWIREEKRQIEFMKDTSIMLRSDVDAILRLYRQNPDYIADTFLKCQARHVIIALDREWNIKDIHKWSIRRKKQTLSMQENNEL